MPTCDETPTATTEHLPGQPWTLHAAAAYLNVSWWTLKRRGKEGKMKLIKIGRFWYVPDAEVARVSSEGVTLQEAANGQHLDRQ